MFIVTLLVLTVLLSYTLASAAQDSSVMQLPTFQSTSENSYRAFARDLILSNRFWIYLILGIGLTLIFSTTIAIALIMHVKFGAIAACIVAACLFMGRAFIAKPQLRRRRQLSKLLQICGTLSVVFAVVILLRS